VPLTPSRRQLPQTAAATDPVEPLRQASGQLIFAYQREGHLPPPWVKEWVNMNYKDKMERGIALIQAQGQGVFEIEILFPWHILELIRCSGYDEQAARVICMLNQAIADMSKRKPAALWLLCDHTFRKGQAPAAFSRTHQSIYPASNCLAGNTAHRPPHPTRFPTVPPHNGRCLRTLLKMAKRVGAGW